MPDNTAIEQPRDPAAHLAEHKFKPGQSGNPAGRPKSARSKLTESFIKALADNFEENGVAAIELLRTESPKDYLLAVGKLVPKEFDIDLTATVIPPMQMEFVSPDLDLPKADED